MASQMAQVLNSYRQTMPKGGLERGTANYFAQKEAGERSELRGLQKEAYKADLDAKKQKQMLDKIMPGIFANNTEEKWISAQKNGFVPEKLDFKDRDSLIAGYMMQEQPDMVEVQKEGGGTELVPKTMAYGRQTTKGREMEIKEEGLDLRREEAAARRDEQALARETNELKREELRLKIDQRREGMETKKQEIANKARQEVRQQNTVIGAIDKFMANDEYIDAMTGWRGRVPEFLSVTDAGIEAQAYFDEIKNNLTLENLDKMTGVLSETDIKILSGAATAMREGMSKPVLKKELQKIKDVLKTKSAEVQQQILQGGQPAGQAQQGGQQTPQTQLSGQDQAALEWANANPNDPRAAQIKQRLGVQ